MQTEVLKSGDRKQTYYKLKVTCEWCKAILGVPNTKVSLWNRFDVGDGYMASCPACERNTTVEGKLLREADVKYLEKLCEAVRHAQRGKAIENVKGNKVGLSESMWDPEVQQLDPVQMAWLEQVQTDLEPELEITNE